MRGRPWLMTVLASRLPSHSLPLNCLYYGNIKCMPHPPANTRPYFNPPLNIEINFKEDTHNTATSICNILQSCRDPSVMHIKLCIRGEMHCVSSLWTLHIDTTIISRLRTFLSLQRVICSPATV
jgi:hypothetical protein